MTNRWLILWTGVIADVCVGATLAFSVFAKPLMAMFKWTQSEVSLLFTIVLAMMPISMMIAGKVQDLRGPKMIFIVGGALYAASWFLSGYANSLKYLYFVYGVLGGLGCGAIYSCTVVNTIKWFPDKRGMATGVISAGLASGAVVFAPLGVYFIQNYGLLMTFKIFGVIFLLVVGGAAYFSEAPPVGYKPTGWEPQLQSCARNSIVEDKDWRGMLLDPLFYILWVTFVLSAVSGLMVIGHAATIAQEVVKLTPTIAGLTVSIIGMSSASGRIFWGWISDKVGRFLAVAVMFIISAVSMLLLSSADTFAFFVIILVGIGSCYGGFFALFPPITSDLFGAKNLGLNWGIMFTAFAPAAIIGPTLAAKVKMANNGDYSQAFLMAALFSIIGLILTIVIKRRLKKKVAVM